MTDDIDAVIARVRAEIEDGLPCESSATIEAMIAHIDAQAARIAALEQRCKELGALELPFQERNRLNARIAALEGALEPFASKCGEVEKFVEDRARDGCSPIMPTKWWRLADFRRARALLTAKEKTDAE